MNWQPIETAPKDGTRILVTRFPATSKPPINIAWWSEKRLRRGCYPWRITCKSLPYDPTHWMPLPQPPEKPE